MALPTIASAEPSHRHHHKDRFDSTWALGATLGVGSPAGVAGGFLEVRPARFLALDALGGLGGAFGPGVGGEVFVSPVGTRGFAVDLGVGFSRNFSWVHGPLVANHPSLPAGSNWLSAEGALEFRPSRGFMLRVGVGHAWLLNTADFGVATSQELSRLNLQLHGIPGGTPYDAVQAAAQGVGYGLWFVHLDIAPTWGL